MEMIQQNYNAIDDVNLIVEAKRFTHNTQDDAQKNVML